jgi:hypothetical protein
MKPYIFPKWSKTTNRSKNAFEVGLKRSVRDMTLEKLPPKVFGCDQNFVVQN